MDFTELRRHPRVIVDFFADWGWGPECDHYDKITSLSLGGCFLATKREPRAGQEIYLRLTGEASGMINLRGAVRYQLRLMEGASPTGAGIEFIGVSSESERKLQAVVDNYR
jgi:hypothetical protein